MGTEELPLVSGGRASRPVFSQVFEPFDCFYQVLFGWGVLVGGDKNVIHIASMPKHWYLQFSFASSYNTLRKDVEQQTLSQASMSLVTGTRKAVTGVHAFSDHAQSTGICSAFVSLRVAGCGLRVNTLNLRNRNTM